MADTTKVLPCRCNSSFQDATYGPDRRVHNAKVKDRRIIGWVCTVCSAKKDASSGDNDGPKGQTEKAPTKK